MKILVTGGMGLIGHNVVYKLLQLGHEPIIVDNKTTYGILDRHEVNYLMEDSKRYMHKSAYTEMSKDDFITEMKNKYVGC